MNAPLKKLVHFSLYIYQVGENLQIFLNKIEPLQVMLISNSRFTVSAKHKEFGALEYYSCSLLTPYVDEACIV